MHDPLLAPLIAVASGILLSRLALFGYRESWLVALAFTAIALFSLWRGTRRLTIYSTLLALLAAGVLVELSHRPGPPPELDAASGEAVVLSGCVVEPAVFHETREQFTLELEPGARVHVGLNLREGERPPPLRYGQRVEVEARIRRLHNFGNPGAFDYVNFLNRQQVFWTASARQGATVSILPGTCGSRFFAAIFALRVAALDRLESLYAGKPYTIAMLEGILIGETTNLEKAWTEHFRRTGTFHALVISGQHVSVLAMFLLFLLRLCFIPELPALAIAASGAWVYAMVSGWSAPVVRAAGGFTVYLIARYFFRQRKLLNLLAVVALGYILYDPNQMFDASFQLSFLSVAVIGVLCVPLIEATSGPFARGLRNLADLSIDPHMEPKAAQFRVELRLLAETVALYIRLPVNWILRIIAFPIRVAFYVYELVAISAVIQIGLALPMAIYFHRISISGLSANVFIVPIMSLVVPIGFVAIFTGWSIPAAITESLLMWAARIAAWHAQWEPQWRIPDPPWWVSIALVGALVLVAFASRKRCWWRWPSLALAAVFLVLLLWSPFPPLSERGKLELTAIDVGQGDSLLVAFPDGKLMLVDGGGIPVFGNRPKPRLDIGEDVVSPYLWGRGIRHIDIIVATHAHADHIGGIPALIDNFQPRELWVGANSESKDWMALRQKAEASGVKVVALDATRAFDFGNTKIEVLSPPADYEPGPAPKNNDSLAFRLSYGAHSFLLTGDMERQMEARLVADDRVRQVDVLKVAHHGSKTSSIDSLLDAAHPKFAIISDGFENSFHHPHPDVIRRLDERHAEILRTDQLGLVRVVSDGKHLTVDTADWSRER